MSNGRTRGTRPGGADALLEQSLMVSSWLGELPQEDFSQPSVLPGWDVRTLTAHLVMAHQTLIAALRTPTSEPPVPIERYVQRYRPGAESIAHRTRGTAGDLPGPELVELLGAVLETLAERLADPAPPAVILGPRGPIRRDDILATRIIEVVVHSDDLSRSLPEREPIALLRGPLGRCSRTLAAILAGQHPGRSVEVRIPPYAAVQCGLGDPGPTHTRGTPPNVVETDAVTFLRLATGRTTWDATMATGRVHASGLRADLTPALPLLS